MEFHRAKIIKCEPHDNYKLWIQFDDGLAVKSFCSLNKI